MDDQPVAEQPETADGPAVKREWYVLKVQSNRERTIRDSLLKRIRLEGLEDFFGDIIIPSEKVYETKSGKKRLTERKLFPGYMMINMCLNDDTWYLVRDTGGVGDFTGAAGKPIPMQEHEIQRMLGEPGEEEAPIIVPTGLETGDMVKVTEGAFESFEGPIDEVDDATGKIKVMIDILGQPNPVYLEHWQVEKI